MSKVTIEIKCNPFIKQVCFITVQINWWNLRTRWGVFEPS